MASRTFSARRTLQALWPLATTLTIGAALTLASLAPPPVKLTDAPRDEFSAERAMIDVRMIANAPHPTGSPQIETVRRYLVRRLTDMGLAPQVRSDVGLTVNRHFPDLAIAGRTHNILAELEGADPALPAVLVMAHYDTMPHSPGAGDDTSGVSAALEIARALQAGPKLRRSVLFLFTDAEEPGLLGSSAFFGSDPARSRVGLVINLEARGDGGGATLFQTSPQSGGLIDFVRGHAGSASADSLTAAVYDLLPNDTDLTSALNNGFAGLNFAFAGHQIAYHTPLSTPENLSVASLQSMGDQVLPIVRGLADAAELPPHADNLVYSDVLGLGLLAYSPWTGWLLLALSVAMVVAASALSIRRARCSWKDIAAGAATLVVLALGCTAILRLEQRLMSLALGDAVSPHALIGRHDPMLAAAILLLLGTGAATIACLQRGWRWSATGGFVAIAATCSLLGGIDAVGSGLALGAALISWLTFRRPYEAVGAWCGGLAVTTLLAAALQVLAPLGGHVLAWPLLLTATAALVWALSPVEGLALGRQVAVVALLAASLYLLTAQGLGFFTATGPVAPMIVAPFGALIALTLMPLIRGSRAVAWIGVSAVVAGLAIVTLSGRASPQSQTPRIVEAFYVADLDQGTFHRASTMPDLAPWTAAALAQDGAAPAKGRLAPLLTEDLWLAKAAPRPLGPPHIALSAQRSQAGQTVTLTATPRSGGRYFRILLRSTRDLTNLTIDGHAASTGLPKNTWSQVSYHAPGNAPVTLGLQAPAGPGRLEVKVVEVRDGWPRGAEPVKRPENVLAFRKSDSTWIAAGSVVEWR